MQTSKKKGGKCISLSVGQLDLTVDCRMAVSRVYFIDRLNFAHMVSLCGLKINHEEQTKNKQTNIESELRLANMKKVAFSPPCRVKQLTDF